MADIHTPASGTDFRDDARRRRPLPNEILAELTKMRDWPSWLAVGRNVGAIALLAALGLQVWPEEGSWVSALWLAPVICLIALAQQGCFVLAHDAAHYRLFKRRAVNDLAGRVLAGVVGISMCSYRIVHRLHHNNLYGDGDPDLPIHAGYPRGRRYLLKKLGRDLMGLTAPKAYAYFFGSPAVFGTAGAHANPLDDTAPALRTAARRDRWLVVAFHVAAPLGTWWFGYLLEYMVLWVLPLVTVMQATLRFRSILEHGAVTDLSSPLTAARTNVGPWWIMSFLFPHNVHYHVEHHLYPAIPHYNLPACHAELAKRGWLDEAEVRQVSETVSMVFAERLQQTA